MNNFTTNTYEMKREILNFSKKVSVDTNKVTRKFIMDMQYGLSKSQSCLISNISRALDERVKLKNTIERLCDNLIRLSDEDKNKIKDNYFNEIKKYFGDNPVVIFDDSDISKRYGKKFEDIDRVIDASDTDKKVVNGYHVCEAVILGEKEKQPFSVYSEIYSCKSDGFISKNKYTIDSINTVTKVVNGKKCDMVFDRGYDDNKIIEYIDKSGNNFVIRMNDRRNFIFKNKKKNAYKESLKRKGKVKMELWFESEKYEVSVSHTKVTLPSNKKDYELVFVYGLSEERPLILLTNRSIHSKEDVIKVVRLYFYRWRVEEYFRSKKQEYDFENMRVRTLKAMNNLNLMLMIHMGHLSMLIEDMDKKLLTIKIIESSKSIRNKILVWISQIARGISNILKYAHEGIKKWQEVEVRSNFKQLELKL